MTQFQLMMAATIANLRRTWNWQEAQLVGGTEIGPIESINLVNSAFQWLQVALGRIDECFRTREIGEPAIHRLTRLVTGQLYHRAGNARFRLGF